MTEIKKATSTSRCRSSFDKSKVALKVAEDAVESSLGVSNSLSVRLGVPACCAGTRCAFRAMMFEFKRIEAKSVSKSISAEANDQGCYVEVRSA